MPQQAARIERRQSPIITDTVGLRTALTVMEEGSAATIAYVDTKDALKEDKAKKGVANGYAPLDATIKVPAAYLPAGIEGPMGPAGPQGPQGETGPAGTTSWIGITDKPTSFPPSAHVHPQSEITNLVSDLALKAPLAGPTFTGLPAAPTASLGTSTTQLATTAFVAAAVSSATGGTIGEAPNDGGTYGRKSLGWTALDTSIDWTEVTGKPATFPPPAIIDAGTF